MWTESKENRKGRFYYEKEITGVYHVCGTGSRVPVRVCPGGWGRYGTDNQGRNTGPAIRWDPGRGRRHGGSQGRGE